MSDMFYYEYEYDKELKYNIITPYSRKNFKLDFIFRNSLYFMVY